MDDDGRKRKREDDENARDESKADEEWFRRRQQQAQAQAESLRLTSVADQLNRAELVRSSLQASAGSLNPSALLPQGLPSRATGGLTIPEVTLNNALLPNTASLARSTLLRNALQGNPTWPPAPAAPVAPLSLPSLDPSARNLATGYASLPFSFSSPSFSANPLLMGNTGPASAPSSALHMSLLDQVSVRQRLNQTTSLRQLTQERFGQNPMPSLMQSLSNDPSAMDNRVARLPSFQYQQLQPNAANEPPPSSRAPVMLYLPCDDESLTPYQCLARRQIELFEATPADVEAGTQGRNRSIVLGQVGIRCRHCSALKLADRARGSTYYPRKLQGLYQAGQNMSNSHLLQYCTRIPKEIRDELQRLGNKKSSAGGGKDYWSGGAKILGVIEDEQGLRFEKKSRPL
ncbi:expressed unknown protein [Seminavis robusta]|uniref:Uncharacterized protein n=1 Tax=Seminavis robusta TaxID=568900 RepID=A0A9N8I038_9STRA|nr:expressed unknown protein [Seminavis robusta]|eukprot:Sro2500_g329420.1 n/a (403) ;mRNA; r:4615-5986